VDAPRGRASSRTESSPEPGRGESTPKGGSSETAATRFYFRRNVEIERWAVKKTWKSKLTFWLGRPDVLEIDGVDMKVR